MAQTQILQTSIVSCRVLKVYIQVTKLAGIMNTMLTLFKFYFQVAYHISIS